MIRSETTAPIPTAGETVALLPSTSATSAALPRMSQTTLPAGTIPVFPPRAWADLTGEGSLLSKATVNATAALTGSGTIVAAGVEHQSAVAALTSTATLTADVLHQSGVAALTGSGSISAVARSNGTAHLTGSGSLSSLATVGVKAPLTGSGALTSVARVNAVAALTGSGTLTSLAQTAVAMGMDKSGNQTLPNATFTTLTSWTARSGFPSTVIESNGLKMRGGTYVFVAKATKDSSSDPMQIRIYSGGTQIGSATSGSTDVSTLTCTTSATAVADNAIITVQVWINAGGRNVLGGSTNTYLTATPV